MQSLNEQPQKFVSLWLRSAVNNSARLESERYEFEAYLSSQFFQAYCSKISESSAHMPWSIVCHLQLKKIQKNIVTSLDTCFEISLNNPN